MAASITLNGGWAVSRGVELAGAAGLTNALRLRGTWSYTRAALSQDSPGLLDGASKFDGVLGRSTQPIEAVPKVLSARAPPAPSPISVRAGIGDVATGILPVTWASNGVGGQQIMLTSGGRGYIFDLRDDTFTPIDHG